MSSADRPSFRGRLGALASHVLPNIDERAWRRARRSQVAELRSAGAGLAEMHWPKAEAAQVDVSELPPHIVVVPMDGPSRETWRAAGGNFFYEIQRAAREYLPATPVTIFHIAIDEPASSWHPRLAEFLIEVNATHLIAQVEADPERAGTWTWDLLWSDLSRHWHGVLLGVVFDSAFRMITLQSRELARISSRFLLVDICMPMDGVLKRGRVEVGPVNMPVSNESLAVIDERTAALPKIHDVSFIGALYPSRVALIEQIRGLGVNIAVNPHRTDQAADFAASRSNQPTYVDYMQALAQSRMTINFSESSAGGAQQLKTRILEATAVGCFVLTDDRDRTERFWSTSDFGSFTDPDELPALISARLDDLNALEAAALRSKARARQINDSSFWGGIQAGLAARGLPPLDPTGTT
ncbi:MAG: glycosyltransferase [Actinomycetota bacterium]|nr:glycosyltransferase [Actinomycetota bacterium]